jgi:ABC-2 type transport system permease protein
VIGKFLAAWAFCGIALALTFPVWLTVRWLGQPDDGVILASYVGSFLMAGAFLAIGACMSAMTRNQVIAFVLGAAVCFLFTLFGSPIVTEFFAGAVAPEVLGAMKRISLIDRFNGIVRGVISARDIVFFLTFTGFWLFATVQLVAMKKAA